MKILIVRTFPNIMNIHTYNVQELGLAKALVSKGLTCDIVFYNGHHKSYVEEIDGIKIYWRCGINILKNGILFSLGKIVRNYDVIQVHEYDQLCSWFYYTFSKKPVVIYHGPYYDDFNKRYNIKCKIFDRSLLKCSQKNNVCLAKSELAADFLRTKGFHYVNTVGVGLDTSKFVFGQDIENKIEIAKDKFTIVYIGKIEPRRNIYFLLNIFKEVANRGLPVEYLIIGDGKKEYVQQIQNEIKHLDLQKIIRYYQSVDQKGLISVYQDADLMLFPTHYDIFGMILLEALYFGLPVISSYNGGASMVLKSKENGLIIPEFNVIKWADAIENEYRNPTTRIKKDYSWNNIVDLFIQGYNESYALSKSEN